MRLLSGFLCRQWTLLASFCLFFVVWQLISIFLQTFLFPGPLEVIQQIGVLLYTGEIFPHMFASIYRALIGLFFGALAAIALGYLTGLNSFAQKILKPIAELLRPIPPIAWIPIAILWFGIGDGSAFFIIFIASFFPIFTNIFFGVKSIPLVYERVAKNLQLSAHQKFQHIIFPFTLPHLLAGLKTAIGFSWMAIIAAEMIASQSGLGYFIEYNRLLLMPQNVIAAMLIIGIIGFLLERAVSFTEKRALRWRAVAYE